MEDAIIIKYKWSNEDKYGDLVCELTEFFDKYILDKFIEEIKTKPIVGIKHIYIMIYLYFLMIIIYKLHLEYLELLEVVFN